MYFHELGHCKRFETAFNKYAGPFDDHISKSIPGYRETQLLLGEIISEIAKPGETLLDIGCAQGSFIKAIAEAADGRLRADGLDPLPSMRDSFLAKSVPENCRFLLGAFGSARQQGRTAWIERKHATTAASERIPFFDPDCAYTYVYESMTFQFLSADRKAQIRRCKELLDERGVLILLEKIIPASGDEWRENEGRKDAFKLLYFSAAEIEQKKREILGSSEDEIAAKPMHRMLARQRRLEKLLREKFSYSCQFWQSANFAGYLASDYEPRFKQILDRIPTQVSPISAFGVRIL